MKGSHEYEVITKNWLKTWRQWMYMIFPPLSLCWCLGARYAFLCQLSQSAECPGQPSQSVSCFPTSDQRAAAPTACKQSQDGDRQGRQGRPPSHMHGLQ